MVTEGDNFDTELIINKLQKMLSICNMYGVFCLCPHEYYQYCIETDSEKSHRSRTLVDSSVCDNRKARGWVRKSLYLNKLYVFEANLGYLVKDVVDHSITHTRMNRRQL